MQCECTCNGRGTSVFVLWHVEEPFVEHELRAGVTFFAGLKHKEHATRNIALALRQHVRCLYEHCGVCVVPACVHDVLIHRRKIEPRIFRHGQSIHVATEQHRWPWLVASEQSGNTTCCFVQRDVEWEAIERGEHLFTRDGKIVSNFRMAVQRTAQGNSIFLKAECLSPEFRTLAVFFGEVCCWSTSE